MTQSEYEKELEARGRQFLENIALSPSTLWAVNALMALGKRHDQIDEIVGQQSPETVDTLAAIELICRWGEELPEWTKARFKELLPEAMVSGIRHRGNTENHWIMYYTETLLATEQFPQFDPWWSGLSVAAAHAEAKRWLLGIIDRTVRLGHHEYDSVHYHHRHVMPYVTLADNSRDPEVRAQAARMATMNIGDMALEYFHGSWVGGHSRGGYRQNTWTITGCITGLQFYYFGDVPFDPTAHNHESVCPAVTARFKPPALLAELARDRGRPMVVKKTKAPRAIYRHVEREAEPVRKYTYLSPSFALGSTQLGLPGPPAGPIDLVSWDLSWIGVKRESAIVSNHPYVSPGRFSAFLSEHPQAVGRFVGLGKPFLQNPDRLSGASPYEQMMQHESAIVVLYRIPPEDPLPHVNLFLPRGMVWVEQGGWILGEGFGFYVGMRPIGRYRWMETLDEDLVDGWLIRIDGREVGLALEAVEAREMGPFEAFCERMTEPRLDLSGWPDAGTARFATLRGPRMEMVYDGPHRVDGKEIDYGSWPMFEAPGAQASLGTGRVVFSHGGEQLELDFGVDPEKPLLPLRVIG